MFKHNWDCRHQRRVSAVKHNAYDIAGEYPIHTCDRDLVVLDTAAGKMPYSRC